MPNWSSVTYKITGDPKQVKSLYTKIDNLSKRSTPLIKNGFGNLWLGCLVERLGKSWKKIPCRGSIEDYNLSESSELSVLTFYVEWAWSSSDDFHQFLVNKFPGIELYFQEEECGMGIYVTNDAEGKFFPERYLWDNEEEPLYFEHEADLLRSVNEHFNVCLHSVSEVVDYFDRLEEEDDAFNSIHEFTVI